MLYAALSYCRIALKAQCCTTNSKKIKNIYFFDVYIILPPENKFKKKKLKQENLKSKLIVNWIYKKIIVIFVNK